MSPSPAPKPDRQRTWVPPNAKSYGCTESKAASKEAQIIQVRGGNAVTETENQTTPAQGPQHRKAPDSGQYVVQMLQSQRLSSAQVEKATQHVDTVSQTSSLRIAKILRDEVHGAIQLVMKVGKDADGVSVVLPDYPEAIGIPEDFDTISKLANLKSFSRLLIIEVLEITLEEPTKERVEAIMEWIDQTLLNGVSFENEAGELSEETKQHLEEWINAPKNHIHHTILLRLIIQWFEHKILKHDKDAVVYGDDIDTPNKKIRQAQITNCLLERPGRLGAFLANKEDTTQVVLDEDKQWDIALYEWLDTYIKVAYYKSLIKSPSIKTSYIQQLAYHAIGIALEGIELGEEDHELTPEQIKQISRNIQNSTDPIARATTRIHMAKEVDKNKDKQ